MSKRRVDPYRMLLLIVSVVLENQADMSWPLPPQEEWRQTIDLFCSATVPDRPDYCTAEAATASYCYPTFTLGLWQKLMDWWNGRSRQTDSRSIYFTAFHWSKGDDIRVSQVPSS